jgi:predicted dehydrogenase
MKVGIVGCGVISKHYAENAPAFDAFELVACADLDVAFAEALAADHGLEARAVDDLIAEPAIEIVLNLTPPAAHVEVTSAALAAGKHVYSEKPLATQAADAAELVAEAKRRGLLLACAPDIFLGGAYQSARALIDEGAIGEPVAVSAAMLVGGADAWHPSPEQFFQDGAGPLMDMGPYYLSAIVTLLGPVARVAGFASTLTAERSIAVGPRAGGRFMPTTPTQVTTALQLESGATASLIASFEANDRYVCDLAIHGREGMISLPDPNFFEGPLRIRRNRGDWEELSYASRGAREARGVGLQDLAEAVAEARAPRASGRLGAHIVDIARSVLLSAAESRTIDVATRAERPEPVPVLRLT